MTILWCIDRFGLPGQYRRVWSRLLNDNGIRPTEVRFLSLHGQLKRQLLTKIGSRKAPTWIPDCEVLLTQTIDAAIRTLNARAVVLSSPESLACLGLAPEHATLQALRGSVYKRHGIPHLVMLPMSAWFSMVSQKEIGAANYGFESQDAFTAGQQGAIPAGGDGSHQRGGSSPSLPDGGRSSGATHGTGSTPPRLAKAGAGAGPFAHLANRKDSDRSGDPSGSHGAASAGTRGEDATGSERPDDGRGLRSGLSNQTDGGADNGPDSAEARQSADTEGRSGSPSQGGGGLAGGEQGDRGESNYPRDYSDLPVAVGRSEDAGESEESVEDEDEPDPDAGEVDQFFYEPVLSPVGRFVLTADTQKLFRILRDGDNAGGPSRPITLQWWK